MLIKDLGQKIQNFALKVKVYYYYKLWPRLGFIRYIIQNIPSLIHRVIEKLRPITIRFPTPTMHPLHENTVTAEFILARLKRIWYIYMVTFKAQT